MDEPKTGGGPISSPLFRAPEPRRRPAWRTVLWIVVAIVAAIIVAVLLTPHGNSAGGGGAGGAGGRGGSHAGAGGGSGRRPPTVVGVATAQLGDIPIEITALGAVTPQANVTVHTRISGNLDAVYFKEGQLVRAGQLLALVDPRPYQVALEQAQGQLLHDQAALDEARIDLKRYQALASQDSIARQTLDQQAATVKQDEGAVKTDQAGVDSAKLNLVYCHITAPVSGLVGLRQVDPGNFVQTSDTNGVVIINEVDPITVIFNVPEDDIPQIQARMRATRTLPVTAYDRTGAQVLSQGQLYTLDNQIDSSTGTVKARATFANPSGALFAQQFVNVTILVDTLKNAVTIPAVAIRHGPQGDFVYVVQLDSTVKMTPVKVGPAQGETASIASGLSVGDQVVTDGGDRLSDGATVVLPQDAAAMAAQMNRKPKPTGFFGWLQGLFGKTPATAQGAESSAGGGYGSGAGGAGSGAGQHGRGGRMMAIIGQLDLTPDQKTQAQQIFAAARQKAMAADDPTARRAAMQGAMTQLMAILTPEQKAKFKELQAEQANGGGGSSSAAASAAPSAGSTPESAPGPAPGPRHPTQSADAGPLPGGHAAAPAGGAQSPGGGQGGGGGGRMQMLVSQLDLDAGQQAKAQQIFAAARDKAQASGDFHGAMHDAMTQLEAILRPDQKAKLDALRAARMNGGGNGGGQ